MALFNYATRELSAKIVYYGPGLSGKTTNIEMVHKMLRPEQKGRLISLPTETDRTLFFDFLPIDLGQIKGFKVRFHLYTVPGQVFYNATRRLVLQGVDGVVFVADSQREMANSNMESLKNLRDNLSSYGKKLEDLPFVIQYNKRDLKNIATVNEMDAALNFLRAPAFEAVAPAGKGVTETLVAISRIVFTHLRKTLLMPGEMAAHEDLPELADARIQKTFAPPEVELLEEIAEVEEIPEPAQPEDTLQLDSEPVPLVEVQEPPPRPELQAPPARPEVQQAPPLTKVQEPPPRTEVRPPPRPEVQPPPLAEEQEPAAPVEAREPTPPVEASPPVQEFDELGEIEIERPDSTGEPEPVPARPAISFETEGSGLTFLKFEAPFVSPKGDAVLPALFLDGAGNPVRLRIRISMDQEPP